jgi:hypothetical protein
MAEPKTDDSVLSGLEDDELIAVAEGFVFLNSIVSLPTRTPFGNRIADGFKSLLPNVVGELVWRGLDKELEEQDEDRPPNMLLHRLREALDKL